MKRKYLIITFILIIAISIFALFSYNKSKVRFNLSNTQTFRVSAYNVGNFSLGQSGMPHGGDDLSKEKVYVTFNTLNNVIKSLRSDVYLFSEWDTNFEFCYSRSETDCNKQGITCYPRCDDKTVFKNGNNAIDKFKTGYLRNYNFTKVYPPNNSEAKEYAGQLLASKYSLQSERVIYYKDIITNYLGSNTRSMVDAVININGKKIHFISTHLTPSNVEARNQEYQAIKNYVKNIEYYVIGGDFNIATGSNQRWQDTINELNYLYNNVGYSAQGTESFGDFIFQAQDNNLNEQLFNGRYLFDTYGNKKPYDTIVISKNLCFVNIGVEGNKEASDHLPIYADIGFANNYSSVSKYGVCTTSVPETTPNPTSTPKPTQTPTSTPVITPTPTPKVEIVVPDDIKEEDPVIEKEVEPVLPSSDKDSPTTSPTPTKDITPTPNKDEDVEKEEKEEKDIDTSKSNNLIETTKDKLSNIFQIIGNFLKKHIEIAIIVILVIILLLLL